MKNVILICLAALLFSACASLKSISYDRLQAADISFPDQIRTVGVVNYVPGTPEGDMDSRTGLLEGNGKLAAETLAQEIAARNYFNQVVICDSALRGQGGQVLTDAPMPPAMADSLIQTLGVDMLVSLERLPVQLRESTLFLPEILAEVPGIDGIVTPLVRTYIPGRNAPLFTIAKTDTIAWTMGITLGQLVDDASIHAATLPVDYLLPHWVEVQRIYFDGGSVEMRDAGVYVRENNWEQAAPLWQSVYDKKKGKAKMRAAYNLAVCYEMQDDFARAKEYLETAASLAPEGSWEQGLIRHYQIQLEEQSKENQQLNIQMKRFEP